MKRVTVIGANGFVGRYVAQELTAHSVDSVLTRRTGGELQSGWIRWDLDDLPTSLTDLGSPDVVIHLAWGHLHDYRALQHFEEELPRHYRFLRRLVQLGVPRILVTGTCLEYGHLYGPLREELQVAPTTAYGMAKDFLRRQLEQLSLRENFELVWARLFYVYGEGQRDSSLFSSLRLAAARGGQPFDMSSGEQLRDFLPIEQAAQALVKMALSRHSAGLINVCSGRPISVRRQVEDWMDQHNWSIPLNLGHYPPPEYESLAYWGDRSKYDEFCRCQTETNF